MGGAVVVGVGAVVGGGVGGDVGHDDNWTTPPAAGTIERDVRTAPWQRDAQECLVGGLDLFAIQKQGPPPSVQLKDLGSPLCKLK